MNGWFKGLLWTGAGVAALVVPASCASTQGLGSETHFACDSDEACAPFGPSSRCVNHTCRPLAGQDDSGVGDRPPSAPESHDAGPGTTLRPQAAVAATVNTVQGAATCGATHGELVLPQGNASYVHDELIGCDETQGCQPDVRVVTDGEDGAIVQCMVANIDAEHWNLSLRVEQGHQMQLQLAGVIGKTGGTVSFDETVGSQSVSDPNCALQIVQNASGSFGRVEAGVVWARYSCSNLKNPSSPSGVCSGDGAFLFENCATR